MNRSNDELKSFFSALPASSRRDRRQAYEQLIAVENGFVKGNKMPWMLPAWKRGLAILNEVISEIDSPNHTENLNNHTENVNKAALNAN